MIAGSGDWTYLGRKSDFRCVLDLAHSEEIPRSNVLLLETIIVKMPLNALLGPLMLI